MAALIPICAPAQPCTHSQRWQRVDFSHRLTIGSWPTDTSSCVRLSTRFRFMSTNRRMSCPPTQVTYAIWHVAWDSGGRTAPTISLHATCSIVQPCAKSTSAIYAPSPTRGRHQPGLITCSTTKQEIMPWHRRPLCHLKESHRPRRSARPAFHWPIRISVCASTSPACRPATLPPSALLIFVTIAGWQIC